MVASESWTRLVYAFQPARPVANAIRRLRETAVRSNSTKSLALAAGPSLGNLSGLGSLQDWGLELARDLSDFKAHLIPWEDIDTGALVSGPPGTGKTMFAQALARTCNIPIVSASAAQWQAAGYLNDLLKAMRGSFDEARSKGISLLFIDELDAVGSRSIHDSYQADYKRQVINGLLELLDGFDRRAGVVVIAATNHPENIDPALLRAGRLDRHFIIPLPDASTRQQIFAFHAGLPVPKGEEDHFSQSTIGMSGADIKQLVRDGRRRARRQGGKFDFRHIADVLRPLVALPAEHLRVSAFHEAGHAIVGIELGMELESISISDTVFSVGVVTLGGAVFLSPSFPMKTLSFYRDQITMYLGGLAAEILIFGEFTAAVASDPQSDLGLATGLATELEATLGLGRTLAIHTGSKADLPQLLARDPVLRIAVDEVLEKQLSIAKKILCSRYDALLAIADQLERKKAMSAADVKEALAKHPAARN
ncbi:AAA family ATPase [Rhizobium oryzicola]|uniref:AAA family ATPase n=1 Tax=Rhizobium oryzicola TaxID=1232668 RepID=A0ABT8T649_9HYPH|nr:AAA family ATPase [Rhizobium oryzicola]MDO1585633.1 AAA family ATPase [Rhizobium oryzicola]